MARIAQSQTTTTASPTSYAAMYSNARMHDLWDIARHLPMNYKGPDYTELYPLTITRRRQGVWELHEIMRSHREEVIVVDFVYDSLLLFHEGRLVREILGWFDNNVAKGLEELLASEHKEQIPRPGSLWHSVRLAPHKE